MKTISICIQKGGTGKTTTAINLAAELTSRGKKTLLIDTDPQANASTGLGIKDINTSLFDCLTEKRTINELIIETPFCDVIPSNFMMSEFDKELTSRKKMSPEKFFKNEIYKIEKTYDYVIIDSPPFLNYITLNSVVCSDSVLLVLESAEFSIEGVFQFMQLFSEVKSVYDVKIEGVLLNRVNARTKEHKEISIQLSKIFEDKLYNFFVPIDSKIPKSQRFQNFTDNKPKPCVVAFPSSSASKAFKMLANTIIERTI